MWQVKLTRGSMTQVFGTYATQALAEEQAEPHRGTGYYEVTVVPV